MADEMFDEFMVELAELLATLERDLNRDVRHSIRHQPPGAIQLARRASSRTLDPAPTAHALRGDADARRDLRLVHVESCALPIKNIHASLP